MQAPQDERNDAPRLRRLADLIGDLVNESDEAQRRLAAGIPLGPAVPWPKLAAELGGHWPRGLHGINAGPGVGKSAWSIQAAAEAGCPALFVSCEMAATEVFRRTIARTTATFKGKLARGRISGSTIEQLARRTAAASPGFAILDASLAPLSYGWLRDMCIATRGDDPNLLVVIDSLHAWAAASAPADETEYQTLNRAMSELQRLAGELQCAIVFVAERSKFAMQSGGISAAAGTRKVEYGVETMMELIRDDDEIEDVAGEVPVTVRFTKNRNGRAGVPIAMRFHGGFMRFREATALEVIPGEVKTPHRRRRPARERADLA